MPMNVRSATHSDIEALVQFNQAMAIETEGKALAAQVLEPGIGYLLTHPGEGQYLVALSAADAIAGALMLTYEWSDWRNGRFWWIQSVYVKPEQRRLGVYRSLHAHARGLARNDPQAVGIRLYVERQNVSAQQTYQVLGMVETDYRLYEETF